MPRVKLDIGNYNLSLFNKWVWGNMKVGGYTQNDLAELLNIPRQAVSQRLKGRTEWKLREMFELQHLFGERFDSEV